MAIPIITDWEKYFEYPHEGMGSSYERIVLNRKLLQLAEKHGIATAIETPCFGFTGISGINLMALADKGIAISLEDDDPQRLELIEALWQRLGRHLQTRLNPGFRQLDYPDASFDLSFSFSALWFVDGLRDFMNELARITAKLIFISVPNRDGLGYKLQFRDYSPQRYPSLKPEQIDPPSIITLLVRAGWQLLEADYIDCPPWPDIGMAKEDFLQKWLPRRVLGMASFKTARQAHPLSILDFYTGEDPDFARRMLRHHWFERLAPPALKRRWAHHYYLLFRRVGS